MGAIEYPSMIQSQTIIDEYKAHLLNKSFPCIAAKAALGRQQVKCLVTDHMACPRGDRSILEFLYDFVDEYRKSSLSYHSAAIIFRGPDNINEDLFDRLLWQRLQALTNLDAEKYTHDERVDDSPLSPKFGFSLKEEAFFIIGLHPASSRAARQFRYPTLVFNPHAEFEKLRELNRYDQMKTTVRKRDMEYSGSVNPMLKDFGEASEIYQYSGRQYDQSWKCPLLISRK